MEIKGKVIIVTGASEGIGEALAKKLARAGAKVVLAARNDEKLATLAHELPGSVAVHTDMTQQADIQNLIDRTMEIDGRIDILVNNAGQGMYSPLEHTDIDKYKHIMNLNVYGPLYAMQLVIPKMREQGGGMILNISSRVSKNYFPNLSAYASTKYALNALSLTARAELEKDHIVVSVFHPKMTSTNFSKNAAGAQHPDYETLRRSRPASTNLAVDTAEQVAEKIVEQIGSEEPEASM
ncbi:MAG TPA: SDR family NAD(P)-dependent oxidoreductase [Candidatus Paceibacterota bacterium]|nr:SDR family NAD(P)-dependent oxidoreductase [Candidatus Paceibacterota bacterium]